MWYNPNATKQSDLEMFFLCGEILGLALRNSASVGINFPKVFYRQLLRMEPTLLDLREAGESRVFLVCFISYGIVGALCVESVQNASPYVLVLQVFRLFSEIGVALLSANLIRLSDIILRRRSKCTPCLGEACLIKNLSALLLLGRGYDAFSRILWYFASRVPGCVCVWGGDTSLSNWLIKLVFVHQHRKMSTLFHIERCCR